MKNLELKKLIELLEFPDQLKTVIEKRRDVKGLDESVYGFIAMYDALDGDCVKMKAQIASNKNEILKTCVKPKKKKIIVSISRFAAILVLLITSSYFVFTYVLNNRIDLSPKYTDPGIPNFMSADLNHEISKIMFYYRKKDYRKADELIQVALKQKPSDDTLKYYASVILFLDGSGDLGMKGFANLSEGRGSFKAKSMYYQGLIFVEKGNFQMAIDRFNVVLLLNDEAVSFYAKTHIEQLELYQKSK